nr:MAG TPA: hypothetical protein [Caudoviricetes sp.]
MRFYDILFGKYNILYIGKLLDFIYINLYK